MSLPASMLVDTLELLEEALADLDFDDNPVAVAFEGQNLGRRGRLSLVQLYSEPSEFVWLTDVLVLGKKAFEYEYEGLSLQKLMQNEKRRKFWFDGRNGCAALYHQYSVRCRNFYDIQLLDLAWRQRNEDATDYVQSLGRLMTKSPAFIYDRELKAAGPSIAGDNFSHFSERPLSSKLMRYAGQDASCLPQVYRGLHSMVRKNVDGRVERETKRRIAEAESPSWDSNAAGNAKVSVFF